MEIKKKGKSMIENINDLDQQVEKTQPTQEQPKKNYQGGNNQKPKRNLWEDNNIKALSLSLLEKKIGNKAFSVFYNSRAEVPEDVQARLVTAVKYLSNSGYNFRAWYSGDDMLGTKLTTEFTSTGSQNITWYIPWKKYNEKVPTPHSRVNKELAFQLVRGIHKGYDKLPPVVRAICARDMEIFLTEDGKHPLTFVLIYTPCGSEELPDNPDYKVLGQMSFIFRLAKALGIPVYNLKHPNVGERLKELLEGKVPGTPPVQQPTVTETLSTQSPVQQSTAPEVTETHEIPVEKPQEQVVDPVSELLG